MQLKLLKNQKYLNLLLVVKYICLRIWLRLNYYAQKIGNWGHRYQLLIWPISQVKGLDCQCCLAGRSKKTPRILNSYGCQLFIWAQFHWDLSPLIFWTWQFISRQGVLIVKVLDFCDNISQKSTWSENKQPAISLSAWLNQKLLNPNGKIWKQRWKIRPVICLKCGYTLRFRD